MRRALTVAVSLAAAFGVLLPTASAWAADPASPAAAASAPTDPTTTDIRCIIVAGSLSQNSDPDLQKLGAVSLFYFWGRLEGRRASDNVADKVADQAAKMTADDINAQAKVCGAIFTAASQDIQNVGTAINQRLGPAAPAK